MNFQIQSLLHEMYPQSGVLERSVQDSTLIELAKQPFPSAVTQPWAGVAPLATADDHPVSAPIGELFDRMDHAVGLLLLFATVLTMGILFSSNNSVQVWLRYGAIYGLLIFLALFVIFGLRGRMIEARSFPNQGMFLSGWNALRIGLLAGYASGLLFGLLYYPLLGLTVGLRLGLFAAFWFGGFDLVKHTLLRLLLYLDGRTPRRFIHFLDWAASVQLLHRVGGGYVFANRLIQEYFSGKSR